MIRSAARPTIPRSRFSPSTPSSRCRSARRRTSAMASTNRCSSISIATPPSYGRTPTRAARTTSNAISMHQSRGPSTWVCSASTNCSRRAAAGGASMTTNGSACTASELIAILSARQLKDGQVVFAGVGIPLLAATLAQRLHCPGLTILFEGGVIGAFIEPGKLPPSTNDQRCTSRANMVLGSAEVLLLLQRGYVDIGFMGGAQIDKYGNLNSSFIGDFDHPKTRLPGTGGGNDISSLTNMIVAMKHEKRRFVDQVDFITSPGWIRGGRTRSESGLPEGGMFRVITELAVFSFDETSRLMKVLALNPGITREQVQDNTGFDLIFEDQVNVTEP